MLEPGRNHECHWPSHYLIRASIANVKMPHLQGTLGFYFTGGGESEDILAATACRDLFLSDEENSDYAHTKDSMPRKNGLFMGTMAWQDYLQSV